MARRRSSSKSRFHKKAMRSREQMSEARIARMAEKNPVTVTKVAAGLTLAEMREAAARQRVHQTVTPSH